MSSRILVDGGTAMGKQVLEYVHAVVEAREKGRRLLAALNSMSYGIPADYAQVAAELGLPAPSDVEPINTQAQDCWAIISTAQGVVDSGQVAELSRLDQGG
jgi:hypothetical protein